MQFSLHPWIRGINIGFLAVFQAVDWAHVMFSSWWSTLFISFKDLEKCNCISLYLFLAGSSSRNCMGKLLTALLLSGPLGGHQAQRLWAWTRRMVKNPLFFLFHSFFLPFSSLLTDSGDASCFNCRGLDNYLSVKQVTEYVSDEPWGWYQSPSKLWKTIQRETKCMMEGTSRQFKKWLLMLATSASTHLM